MDTIITPISASLDVLDKTAGLLSRVKNQIVADVPGARKELIDILESIKGRYKEFLDKLVAFMNLPLDDLKAARIELDDIVYSHALELKIKEVKLRCGRIGDALKKLQKPIRDPELLNLIASFGTADDEFVNAMNDVNDRVMKIAKEVLRAINSTDRQSAERILDASRQGLNEARSEASTILNKLHELALDFQSQAQMGELKA